MKTRNIFAALAVLGLLSACAQLDSHPMDMKQLLQNASTPADHEALAKHYEDTAKEMQAEMEDHKKTLSQYEAKGSLYGKQAQTLRNHCEFLIRAYQQATEANRYMAEDHRRIAAEIENPPLTIPQ